MKIAALALVLMGGPALAADTWFCQSSLETVTGDTPRPGMAFRLTLGADGAFLAEGRHGSQGFGWQGSYTRFDGAVALIGALEMRSGLIEARAVSEHVEPSAMILSLQSSTDQPDMVRCLRHDMR